MYMMKPIISVLQLKNTSESDPRSYEVTSEFFLGFIIL